MSNSELSRYVVDGLPGRVLSFLHTAGTNIPVRNILAAHGYTQAEHQQGWALLHAVTGYRTVIVPTDLGTPAANAVAELDALDEGILRRSEAALKRFHPEQAAFVFDNLAPASGAGSVLSIGVFLERLDLLEKSPERAATREADLAALQTLASRGTDAAQRTRLRELVNIAQAGAMPVPTTPPDELSGAELTKNILALKAWHQDWSETAKTVIKRRDQLIQLGLGKRKKSGKKNESDDVAVTDPTVPVRVLPNPAPVSNRTPPIN